MSLRSRPLQGFPLLFAAILAVAQPAVSATIYFDVAGIDGADPVPGYPHAMAANVLTLAPGAITIIKAVDAASPAIQQALTQGTPLASATALFYDAAPPGDPDASLSFQNLLVSSSTPFDFADQVEEQDGFAAATPQSLFLELPGITGESSTPGHPDVMALNSFWTDGNRFEIVKPVDSASPAIQLALTQGTQFAVARLLVYDSATPGVAPDGELIFEPVLVSSSQPEPGGGETPLERDGFSFITITPEPEIGAQGLACIAALAAVARRRATRAGG